MGTEESLNLSLNTREIARPLCSCILKSLSAEKSSIPGMTLLPSSRGFSISSLFVVSLSWDGGPKQSEAKKGNGMTHIFLSGKRVVARSGKCNTALH